MRASSVQPENLDFLRAKENVNLLKLINYIKSTKATKHLLIVHLTHDKCTAYTVRLKYN